MITTVNSSTALTAALKAAQAGDTILLSSGVYSLGVSNLHFATDVTIASADPAHQAVITALNVSGSSGLTISGLELRADAAAGANPFRVSGSADIHFTHLNVHGSLDGDPSNDTNGFLIRSSSDVTIDKSEFRELSFAVSHMDVQGLAVRDSTFHDLRSDGVRGGGSSNVTITGNVFHDFHPITGDHPDAIQFWTNGTTANVHDILVRDNLVYRGAGQPMQGVFMGDEVAGVFYEHVTVEGNLISGGMFHGINIASAHDVTISGNVVQGFSDEKSWIRIDDVDGATIANNSANLITVTAADQHVTQTGNVLIAQASDGGAAVMATWNANHASGGLSLTGTDGLDTLTGGAMADTLSGGLGADLLTGGAGDDIYITTGQAKVVELSGGGTDTVRSSGSFTLLSNVENLELTGTGGSWGSGNALDNRIAGNAGSNPLFGRGGADTILGGAGADSITGGTGSDQLTGGIGADRFIFTRGDGSDVVTDFGAGGEHDVLDLSGFYAAGLTATLSQVTTGVNVSFTSGDQILLQGVSLQNLHATVDGYIF
jgi:Ca2+-binding RTX toxin-like protein